MSHNIIFSIPEVLSACLNAYSMSPVGRYKTTSAIWQWCMYNSITKGRGLDDLCAQFTGFGLHFSEMHFKDNHVRNSWKELSSVMNLEACREEICDLCPVSNDFTSELALSNIWWCCCPSPYAWWSTVRIHTVGTAPSCCAHSIRVRGCKKFTVSFSWCLSIANRQNHSPANVLCEPY